jgi:FkbM family methyltransferase
MKHVRMWRLLVVGCIAFVAFYWGGSHIFIAIYKVSWVLFRKSDLCTVAQSWSGFSEYFATNEAVTKIPSIAKLRSIDRDGLQEWDTPWGVFWFPHNAAKWSVHFALAQFKTRAYPGITIHSGDIVMDCGGYVGDWTKWALNEGAAKVIVIEPTAESLVCLRRNLGAELRRGLIMLYPKGVWDREETLNLEHMDGNPAANTIKSNDGAHGESINVTTIDQIVDELKINRLDIIKMDIEGSEIRAIRGARKTLNRFRPHLAIATEHTQDTEKHNHEVAKEVRAIAPFYRLKCGYCAPHGNILTPETLYFSPL